MYTSIQYTVAVLLNALLKITNTNFMFAHVLENLWRASCSLHHILSLSPLLNTDYIQLIYSHSFNLTLLVCILHYDYYDQIKYF